MLKLSKTSPPKPYPSDCITLYLVKIYLHLPTWRHTVASLPVDIKHQDLFSEEALQYYSGADWTSNRLSKIERFSRC